MASLALYPRPAGSALARDLDPRAALPYARHVTDHVVALDTQALMLSFRLDGASFETADVRDINDLHAKLNGAWRNLADDRLAVWHHLVRREHVLGDPGGYPEGRFRSAFAANLDARYRGRLGATRMFVNELYVHLILHPGRDAAERIGAWLTRSRPQGPDESEAVRRLEEALQRLSGLIGTALDWTDLAKFLPATEDPQLTRSTIASSFVAALELTRTGQAELSQSGAFAPLMLRVKQ